MKELLKFYERLDRTLFIDGTKDYSDFNTALNIVCGQTTPKPTTVMIMANLLELDKDCSVLEIGTGSGYNTAFMAEFAGMVYTIEVFPELMARAMYRLDSLKYTNIQYKVGNGYSGWLDNAPYDRIVMTATADKEPLHLLEQLKPNGIMVAPSYTEGGRQDLIVYYKNDGGYEKHSIKGVRFVPILLEKGEKIK